VKRITSRSLERKKEWVRYEPWMIYGVLVQLGQVEKVIIFYRVKNLHKFKLQMSFLGAIIM